MQHLMGRLAKQDILLEVNQKGFRIDATDTTDWISLTENWSTDYDAQEDQVIDAAYQHWDTIETSIYIRLNNRWIKED